jgi:hypothetical protein
MFVVLEKFQDIGMLGKATSLLGSDDPLQLNGAISIFCDAE